MPSYVPAPSKYTVSPSIKKEPETASPKKKKIIPVKPGSAIRSRQQDNLKSFQSGSTKRGKSQIEEIVPNKTPPKKVVKPVVKKTLRDFLKVCKKLLDSHKFQDCKTVMENAIRQKTYGEIP
jgi:hypothetical protein